MRVVCAALSLRRAREQFCLANTYAVASARLEGEGGPMLRDAPLRALLVACVVDYGGNLWISVAARPR